MAPATTTTSTNWVPSLGGLLGRVAAALARRPTVQEAPTSRRAPRPLTPAEGRRWDAARTTMLYRDPTEPEALVESDLLRSLELHQPR